MDRRTFLGSSILAAGLTTVGAPARGRLANDRLAVAVMGLNGRGSRLMTTFAGLEDIDITTLCDCDTRVLDRRADELARLTGRAPRKVQDFRHALDDPQLDVLVIGTPDHWHALPTIQACQAGKDVYVEKPDAHAIREGRTMIAAARKYNRIVQLGTQGRSGSVQHACMDYVAAGNLGQVRFAKAWESAKQGSIGHPPDSAPPAGVDYDLWLGPAPLRPFNVRRFHGSWRWFFDYGTGDLGNDGVHLLDFARWGLQTAATAQNTPLPALPFAVSAHGGKYYFDDDQQWPDTLMVTYDYTHFLLTYELRIWTPYPLDGEAEGAAVYGDGGYVVLTHDRWRAFDAKGHLASEQTGPANDRGHAENFVACVRTRQRPVADLETVGHPSSLLCHLGNAAWQAGCTLHYDPDNGTFREPEANRYLARAEYREPWTLPAIDQL